MIEAWAFIVEERKKYLTALAVRSRALTCCLPRTTVLCRVCFIVKSLCRVHELDWKARNTSAWLISDRIDVGNASVFCLYRSWAKAFENKLGGWAV